MSDLNWYLMNKDHDFIGTHSGVNTGGPVIAKASGVHLIGVNPPPIKVSGSNDQKITKL